jgi:lysophospholipase L1-like esterase
MRAAYQLLLAVGLGLALGSAGAAEPAKPVRAPRAVDPAFAPIVDQPALPRVLLIGDSISIGYTAPVRELLKGKANVHRIPTNGGPTTRGLTSLSAWLGTSKWDVIHFNWGLHDLKYVGATGDTLVAVPARRAAGRRCRSAEYEANLRSVVGAAAGDRGEADLVRNTTPVPEGVKGRVPGDEVAYNEAAARVMSAAGVPINDLYAHARTRLGEIQRPADVHFTDAGSRYLAEQVSTAIASVLPPQPAP